MGGGRARGFYLSKAEVTLDLRPLSEISVKAKPLNCRLPLSLVDRRGYKTNPGRLELSQRAKGQEL